MDSAEKRNRMKVFISHTLEDEPEARSLSSGLREAGLDVFDPLGDAHPGDNISLQIGKALEDCDAMVILLSPEAVKSPWVKSEIDFALTSPKLEHKVIPVVVRPTDSIPWILRKLSLIRFGKNPARGKRKVVSKAREFAKAAS